MPLDVKTMFEAQKKAEELAKGFDFRTGDQNKELIQLLCKLPTESYQKVLDEVSKLLAVEILRQQIATAKTT